jgi:hypothetical protein
VVWSATAADPDAGDGVAVVREAAVGETPGLEAGLAGEGTVAEEVVAGRLAGVITDGSAGLFFAVRGVAECPPVK